MSECIQKVIQSKVKVEEKSRKAVFVTDGKSEYIKGRIDQCLIKDGVRADYFVSGEGKTVLIELKGCNVSHACDQLFKAVEHENVKPYLNEKIGFLVICSKYPTHDTSVQLAMSKAKKKYKAEFRVYTNKREVNMSMF
ncbi:hypothetical protein ACDW82_01765 [Alcaligenes faecalis]|uniref:hypothetical protein n=1 Tax=Alcaligenes faecalis TaxID=511 RepID=UPI003559140E